MRLSRCCSIDLEVSPSTDEIHALAGVRNDMEATYHSSRTGPSLRSHLRALDTLAEGADFLIGHNVIKFDLPYLRAAQPGLRLLKLPVIDTLWLNPLAFPRSPYHHLVKHYRDGDLRRHTRNDPELDGTMPPVLCLTATAKPDVRSEIVAYFRERLHVEMRVFDGGSKRTNLEFEVVPTSEAVKLHDIHLILEQHLSSGTEGGAIVYCATRRHTESSPSPRPARSSTTRGSQTQRPGPSSGSSRRSSSRTPMPESPPIN